MKTIYSMTRKELEAVPLREWSKDIGEFNSLVLLPYRRIHDSGFRCMGFIAADKEGRPIARMSGSSDVINIGGIGGTDRGGGKEASWSIDCLRKSGLFRLFNSTTGKVFCGCDLSNFEVFSQPYKR